MISPTLHLFFLAGGITLSILSILSMLSILSTVTYVWEICLELRSMAMSSAPLLHIGRRTKSQQELDRTDLNLDKQIEEDNFDSDNGRLLDGRHFTRLRYHFGTYPFFLRAPELVIFSHDTGGKFGYTIAAVVCSVALFHVI